MTPIKEDLAVFTAKLSANVRINLYDKNYLGLAKWTAPLLLVIALFSLSILFFVGALNQTQLIVASLVVFSFLLFIQFIIRRAHVAALKGDNLILNGIDSKSTVTSIRSVKKAQSYQFFGIQITQLTYTLDKQNRSSLVFGSPSGMTTSLDQLLHHAKKNRKK